MGKLDWDSDDSLERSSPIAATEYKGATEPDLALEEELPASGMSEAVPFRRVLWDVAFW